MNADLPGRPGTELVVEDRALARIAATAAAATPGVHALQPRLSREMTRAATGLLRRAVGGTEGGPQAPTADPGAVEIDREPGLVSLTIRVVASGEPAVFDTSVALHRGIAAEILRVTGLTVAVTVQITDIAL